MKKTFLLFIFIFYFLARFPFLAFALEKIKFFDLQAQVNLDGSVDFKETIVADFGNKPDQHGIYRQIPLTKKNDQGKNFVLEFKLKSIVDESGQHIKYQDQSSRKQAYFKIGDPKKTITGIHTYVISYSIKGALTYFSDHDELYWNVNGADWEVGFDKVTAQISLPADISSDDVYLRCYTGSFGSKEQNCIAEKQNGNYFFQTTTPLLSHENLSIVVGFPHGVVAEFFPNPDRLTWQQIVLIAVIIVIVILFYILLPLWIFLHWWRKGRDPKVQPGPRAWFDPPKHPDKTVMSPVEVGLLTDERIDPRDISATIVSLAVRGFLQIEKVKNEQDYQFWKSTQKDDYQLIKLEPKKSTTLTKFEEKIYRSLFKRERKKVKLSHLKKEFYKDIKKAKDLLYQEITDKGYFSKNPEEVRKKYAIFGAIALFFFNILLGVILLVISRFMPKKTEIGARKKEEALSLKRFLSTQERQLTFQEKNWYFFEKLLPYAIVFGVAKVWAERFKDIQMPEEVSWYKGEDLLTTVVLVSAVSSFGQATEAMTGVPYSSSRSSSGFSSGFGGGGFSGGGGGGGGGGGW